MNVSIKRHQEQFIGYIKAFIGVLYEEDAINKEKIEEALIEATGLSLDDYGNKEDEYRDKITLFIERERPEIVLAFLYKIIYYVDNIKERNRQHYKERLRNFIEYANDKHIMYIKTPP